MHPRYLMLWFIAALLTLSACGPTDTVTVVPDAPRTGTGADTTDPGEEEDFQTLRLGMIDPVTHFDPLFAENLSTKRTLSLIYEGLFTLDENGEPTPAIARNVEVSDDSLTYRITINRDIYFHDSNVFSAGVGRRIHAEDVKLTYQRTAHIGVPEHASELLKNIAGYPNYRLEQHRIHDPEKRVLDHITGIETPDAETVVINLNDPDPDFLTKLASPYLYIYPREALGTEQGLKNRPVGTGPYTFNTTEDESITLVLTSSEATQNRFDHPAVNRIDITHSQNEGELFQDFMRSNLDWIPEIGPQISSQVLTDGYTLSTEYEGDFEFNRVENYRLITVYLNPDSEVDHSWLSGRLSRIAGDDDDVSNGYVSVHQDGLTEFDDEETDGEGGRSEYYIPLTDDLFARSLLADINAGAIEPDARLAFLDIRVPTAETSLFTRSTDSIHYRLLTHPVTPWLTVQVPVVQIYHSHINGVQSPQAPWLLHIEQIRVRNSDRTSS